jgi:hypothetical protein
MTIFGQIVDFNQNLGKDDLTSLLCVKKGADSKKSSLIDPTQDINDHFNPYLTIFGQIVSLIIILGNDVSLNCLYFIFVFCLQVAAPP